MTTDLKNGTDLGVPTDTGVAVGASAANSTTPGLWTFANIYSYLTTKLLSSASALATIYASSLGKLKGSSSTVTITIASPGVVSWTAHGLADGTPIVFATTGALPTGLTAGVTYYVKSPTTNAFNVAATSGGSAINTSGTQSGTHTANAGDFASLLAGPNYTVTVLASAATCDIGAASTPYVDVTGTTTITSLGTAANRMRFVRFLAALTLTHNASTLILPTGANITTAADDVGVFRSNHAGAWRCVAYQRADGTPLAGGGGAGVTDGDKGDIVVTGSGSAWNFDSSVVSTYARTLLDDADAPTAQATLGVRERLTANRTYYIGANIPRPTISIASPAVVSSTAHGLSAGDPVVFNVPINMRAATMTIATPGVFTLNSHGFAAGQPVKFDTTGALPTGLTAGTTYYVIATGLTTNTFQVSATVGGSAVNTSGTQSGTHYCSQVGALPTGITDGTTYYVIAAGLTTNAFQVSATVGGSAVNTTGTVTGTPTYGAYTGNDNNNGKTQSRTGAFLTPQKALDTAFKSIDLNGFNCDLQLAAGTFTQALSLFGLLPIGGIPKLKGDTTTPSNYLLSVTGNQCVDIRRGVALYSEGFRVSTTTSGHGFHVSSHSYLGFTGAMEFANVVGSCVTVDHESVVGLAAGQTFVGAFGTLWASSNNSDIEAVQGPPANTLLSVPSFTNAGMTADRGGIIETDATWAGTATGKQFAITYPGSIKNSTTYPGSVAGTYADAIFGSIISPTIGSSWIQGDGTARNIGAVTPTLQTHGNTTNTAAAAVFRWSNDTGPARYFLAKSRGASVGSLAIVQNADVLSEWVTYADTGTQFQSASSVRTTVDGTPGATNDMPTKLELMVCADGTATLAAGITIRQDKTVEFNGISTTASAANAFLDSANNNKILRSTSSLTYKTDVEAVDAEVAARFLSAVEPIWYHSLADADKLDDGKMKSFYSFGAEALAKIDPRLVNWGYQPQHYEIVIDQTIEEAANGEIVVSQSERRVLKDDAVKVPDGVNDRAIIALLTSIIQRHEKEIAELKARLN